MSDPRVSDSQIWLNDHYVGVPGYEAVLETGVTGWPTMYALTRALQHELGITALSDNFGSTTMGQLALQYADIGSTITNTNIIGIIQCALWCKGYFGGSTFGVWDSQVENSIESMRANMGIPPAATAKLTPKMFKSMLTMDAYTRIGSGTAEARAVQQWLNGRYLNRMNYYILPCDGIYSRDVQKGLVYAIQYEIGLSDSVANGNFGPSTQTGVQTYGIFSSGSDGSGKQMRRLYQAALIFNKMTAPFTGTYDTTTQTASQAFQAFAELPVTAGSSFSAWASLLVSTGDVSRTTTAADASTPLTPSKATTLYNAGYRTIGRYLTVEGKRYQPGELATIFAAGLTTVPIYQNYNDSSDDFTPAQGEIQGRAAVLRARQLGFKAGAIIYFAVDYDATGDEITSLIIPFFEAVKRGVESSRTVTYQIGIYGTRNVCTRVTNAGIAVSSFVSGMSTGYSGNLGFLLPSNWAYDQIQTTSIGSGGAAISIDRDVKSVRATPVTSTGVLATPLRTTGPVTYFDESFWQLTEWVVLAEDLGGVTNELSVSDYSYIVLQFLMSEHYASLQWQLYTPLSTSERSVQTLALLRDHEGAFERTPDTDVVGFAGYDIEHFAASARSYQWWGTPAASGSVEWPDMGGWAGDLVGFWRNYEVQRVAGTYSSGIYQWFLDKFPSGRLNQRDWLADIDAFLAAKRMSNDPTRSIADVMREIMIHNTADPTWRYNAFWTERFGGFRSNVKSAVAAIFTFPSAVSAHTTVLLGTGLDGDDPPVRAPGASTFGGATTDPTSIIMAAEIDDIAEGFATVLENML